MRVVIRFGERVDSAAARALRRILFADPPPQSDRHQSAGESESELPNPAASPGPEIREVPR